MKFNIQALQAGGGMPFVAYHPRQYLLLNTVLQQPAAPAAPALELGGSQIDMAKILSDSSIKELIKNGLPNEVDYFFKTLEKFESGAPFDQGLNRGELYALANMASQIISNKKEFDNAQTSMVKNESMNEWAGEGNYIFVRDNKTHEIKEINIQQYLKRREKYTPIRNNELLRANAYDSDLAFNSQITSALKDTMGSHVIAKQINEMVKQMGSQEMSQEDFISLAQAEGLEIKRNPTNSEIEGLQQLKQAMDAYGDDALFVLKLKNKDSNVEAAFKYIWSALPDTAKDVLKRKSLIEGDGNFSPENVIASAIQNARVTTSESSIDVESSTKAKAESTKTRHITPHEQLINGDLGQTTMEVRSSKIPNVSMVLHGTQTGHMTTENGSPVMAGPLDMALYESGYVSYVDQNLIYFGNAKLNPAMFGKIIYNGLEVLNVWMPVDRNGNIAFEQAAMFSQFLQELDNNPGLSIEQKNLMLRQKGIDGYLDNNNVFHGGNTMEQFLVTTGETTGSAIDADANIYADELQGETRKQELERLEQIYDYINRKGNRKGDSKYELPTKLIGKTSIVRAPIFMKLSRTAQFDASTNSGVGSMVQNPTLQQNMQLDQSMNISPATTGSSLLYNE